MDRSRNVAGAPRISRTRAYTWGVVLAALTCPCHLRILAVVLAGTSVGAFIGQQWGIAATTLTGLFVLFLTRALRAFRERT